MSAPPAEPSAAWADPAAAPQGPLRRLGSRIATMSLAELRKIRHDRTELYMRAIQPALWLLIFRRDVHQDPRHPHHRWAALP